MAKKIKPIHPGEHLAEFLDEFQISQHRFANDVRVLPRRINEIVHGKRGITADTALRVGHYFVTSAQYWLILQGNYDLGITKTSVDLGQIPVVNQ